MKGSDVVALLTADSVPERCRARAGKDLKIFCWGAGVVVGGGDPVICPGAGHYRPD